MQIKYLFTTKKKKYVVGNLVKLFSRDAYDCNNSIRDALSFATGNAFYAFCLFDDSPHVLILSSCDAKEKLELFARQCVLSVSHFHILPPIVMQFLETGNKRLKNKSFLLLMNGSNSYTEQAASACTYMNARSAARESSSATISEIIRYDIHPIRNYDECFEEARAKHELELLKLFEI